MEPDIYERYRELSVNTIVKLESEKPFLAVAHSSSGLGHRPLKAETTGSNPVCATTLKLKKSEFSGS